MSKYSYRYEFEDKNLLFANVINNKIVSFDYSNKDDKNDECKINVFYNYYKSKYDDRHKEILYCFDKLLKNNNVDNFYVFCSDNILIEDDKLVKIKINGQPKFKDFFNIINCFTGEDDINIILNSDCYFDEGNIELIKKYLNNDDAFLLSRWDILKLNPFKIEHFNITNKDTSGCSQDAWIFRGRTSPGLFGDFEMGRAGCDNAIAHEFYISGYNIINPSFTIKVYHYHLSKERTYGDYDLNGNDNRDKYRIPPPYKMIPSSEFMNEMDIVFYNHYHNGDIHYSREFIKDVMKKYKANNYYYYFDTNYVSDKDIIKDCDIKILNTIPDDILEKDKWRVKNNTIYINTWVGQDNRYYVNKYGINLEANYEIYKDIYKKLNIKLENIEFYIPDIDYTYFKIDKIDNFLKGKDKIVKVLVSNGITRSAQCEDFDMNDSIDGLSSLYKNVMFILTDSKKRIEKNNIFYTDDIIKQKCDLNEISYLSNYCDLIIGRSSGPYAFSMTKFNLFNDKKSFICFVDKPEYEWYISKYCNHIISDKYRTNDIARLISTEIDKISEKKNIKTIRRIAFTIVLNGLHHLKHNNYAEFLCKNFDYWVVVEGASKNNGSTSWCKEMPSKYHNNGKSIDGTIEYMRKLKVEHDNIIFIESDGMWNSKDDMVNRAIDEIKKITNSCFLWQIDVDEQWRLEQILKSEEELLESKCKTGKFNVFQFVGDNLISDGPDWAGEPFIRLWNWNGENFLTHEPPRINSKDNTITLLSERMKHYAFYFEVDVKFKNDWYKEHEGLLENWKKLKKEKKFPQHITYLFPNFKGSKNIANSDNLDCRIIKFDDIKSSNKIEFKEKENVKDTIFNNFVDKTYVINLERRKDRLEHITKEMRKINVNFNRFNAIDGKKLSNIKLPDINKSIIATVRSHSGVIKDAIKNKYQKIAIFEDDVIFCDDFDKRFKYYLENIPNDWDIMYLGCHFNSCPDPKLIKNNVYKVSCAYGCFSMILNNKSGLFQKIIETVTESMPYDDFIKNMLPTINAYVFIPFFVKTMETVSDISENKNSFSYDIVNKHFKEYFDENKQVNVVEPVKIVNPVPVQKSPEILRLSNQDMCDEYLRNNYPFVIYYNGRLLFDSAITDKYNLNFNRDHFTLYGKVFSYNGMYIKRK